MIRLIPTLIVAILASSLTAGELSMYGYFEPQYAVSYLDDAFIQLNTNKLRIDLSDDLTDDIMFTGNVNFLNYNGKTTWNLLDFLPDRMSDSIPESMIPLYSVSYDDEIDLDNAYIRMYSSKFTLTVGRQQISVGSGYAWNPTDLFNNKDILDPTYEQPGVNGMRVDAGIMPSYTVSLFYSPDDDWDKSGKLIRLLGSVSHFDFAFSYGRTKDVTTDYVQFSQSGESRDLFGIDINGELLGLGCWTENAYNAMENSDNYWDILAGIDYTLSSGLYVMGEYYRNGRGKRDPDQYSLSDWMRYFATERKTLSRDQLYLYSSYPLTDLITIGSSTVYSLSDNSALIIPTVEYSMATNLMLTFFGNLYTGSEGTMYSNDMGNGGLLRVRAYF
jgi:hypothetical protein